jgi:hypothetical protein
MFESKHSPNLIEEFRLAPRASRRELSSMGAEISHRGTIQGVRFAVSQFSLAQQCVLTAPVTSERVVEIENTIDGNDGSVTATRTVVLSFDRSDKAKIIRSRIKFATEKP